MFPDFVTFVPASSKVEPVLRWYIHPIHFLNWPKKFCREFEDWEIGWPGHAL